MENAYIIRIELQADRYQADSVRVYGGESVCIERFGADETFLTVDEAIVLRPILQRLWDDLVGVDCTVCGGQLSKPFAEPVGECGGHEQP